MRANSVSWMGRLVLAVPLVLALVLAGSGAALAQQEAQAQRDTQAQRQQVQPGNNAPVWRDVRKEGQEHTTSIKGRETGVLIQSLGETWRELRNGWIVPIAGWLILAAACAVWLFYRWRGPIRLHDKPTGRLIRRFTVFQRSVHWTNAICFCILALSGLVMMLGKYVLLPVIGYTLFGWLADLSKTLHNLVGPVFAVTVLVMAVRFAKDALPRAHDLTWIAKGGGIVTDAHVPCGKMNAGQKMWFWGGLVVLSGTAVVTGLIMDFPNFDQTRSTMIMVNVIHSVAAGLVMAIALYHIYMGTIGVQGAYEGMRHGYVDETYAKEHHSYWYDDIKAGKIKIETAQGTPQAPQVAQGMQGVGEPT